MASAASALRIMTGALSWCMVKPALLSPSLAPPTTCAPLEEVEVEVGLALLTIPEPVAFAEVWTL